MKKQKSSQSDMSKAITLSIDWISATAKQIPHILSYSSYPLLHDWENWQTIGGANGYTIGAKHTTGCKAYFNPNRVDMGVHTVYSGNVLRRIEEMNGDNGIDVLRYHIEQKNQIARLDIALDFIGYGLTVEKFQREFVHGNAKTRLKTASFVKSLTSKGHTFYIGSQKTRKKLVRIYDKAAEQGIDGDWIRLEVQLMGKPATAASQHITKFGDVRTHMLEVIKSVVDFPTVMPFSLAMTGCDEVKIGSQSSQKGDTRKWLEEQCIPALVREIILEHDYWVQFQSEVIRRVKYESEGSE